jgi:two-component system, cell cycle sensor histidine kinase and response regulator CckA
MEHIAGRVLIVDDEPALLKMMSAYLTRLGFAVATANRTEQAWRTVETAPASVALAVIDASMPGLSMQDLAARMLRANPTMRVLAASGYPVDMTALEAEAPGRVAFLHKPFSPEMLAAAVRRMLGSQEENL